MAKLAAQLKDKFFGLVGCITSCGRTGAGGHKDAAGAGGEPKSASSQVEHNEIRSRSGPPPVPGGSKPRSN